MSTTGSITRHQVYVMAGIATSSRKGHTTGVDVRTSCYYVDEIICDAERKSEVDQELAGAEKTPHRQVCPGRNAGVECNAVPCMHAEKRVRKLLDSTEEGLIIKNSYGSSKQFLRSNLCTLIIKNELKHSDDKSTERFKQLAQEINNIFIHEDPSVYYLPYTRGVNGKVVAARRKLWSTYVHQHKIYREAGLIKKQITVEPSTSNDKRFVDISGEDEDSLIWLKNNSQPFEDVSQHWRKTTKLRLQLFKDETIADYFKKYPALRLQTGYVLLRINMMNKDAKEVMVLKYLPLLLQSPLIKAKPKHWKPSKRELIDGFVLFIHDAADVCFKIYHALNAKYPADAEPSWLFLQKAIYKIFTSQDPKFSSVDILIADIKAEQQKTSELV
ncbi:hypothetical protein ILUMI_20585 [Ignelater luminosus]|uniref:Uncharacterized protein n=1 Tax=Ignelater luminosus TaxID=2038154 RepID=A0A8K0G4F8_IGNLU|nr:hypothetical protein ILUMI_20585 [Ignelater luminosus]